jgi:Protein of unknown function (DUF2400)
MNASKQSHCPPELVGRFVDAMERLRPADFGFRDDPLLAPLPPETKDGGMSRYLLLAAAIDVRVNSNDIRPFLHALDVRLRTRGDGLFHLSMEDGPLVLAVIDSEQRAGRLRGWQARKAVPRILAEANAFVDQEASADFDEWSKGISSPTEVVSRLANRIYYQGPGGTETRKKMWMLMRWLVRPAPDLRLWSHFSPADLMVPVDSHVARFAERAGIIPEMPKDGPYWAQVEMISAYARRLFTDDPARVDPAFFMWGRGRSRPNSDPDTCHGILRKENASCPLAVAFPCCERCPP